MVGHDGLRGKLEQLLSDRDQLVVDFDAVGRLRVPLVGVMWNPQAGCLEVPLSREAATQAVQQGPDAMMIPVIEERVLVGKQQVETGRVRIHKTIQERQEEIDVPLLKERVEVERVKVDRWVEDPENPPQPREEGDVTILPVLEEVLVVEKRLRVVEELHVRRHREQQVEKHTVELRKEVVDVERMPPETPPSLESTESLRRRNHLIRRVIDPATPRPHRLEP